MLFSVPQYTVAFMEFTGVVVYLVFIIFSL